MIWIALIAQQFEKWSIAQKMDANGLSKELALLSFVPFIDAYFGGYTTRRHQNQKTFRRVQSGKNQKQTTQSVTSIFVKKTKQHPFECFIPSMIESIKRCEQENKMENDEEFECGKCGKIFIEKRSLLSHQKSKQCVRKMAMASNQNDESFECKECLKQFDSLPALKQHKMAKHVGMHKDIKRDWAQNAQKKNEGQQK